MNRNLQIAIKGPKPLLRIILRIHEEGHWVAAKMLRVACDRPVIWWYRTPEREGFRGYVRVHPQQVPSLVAAAIFLGGPLAELLAFGLWIWVAVWVSSIHWMWSLPFAYVAFIFGVHLRELPRKKDLQDIREILLHWREASKGETAITEFRDLSEG